jgi:hypothetical protein
MVQYSDVEADWKSLLMTGIRLPEHWLPLGDELFTLAETQLLAQDFISILVDPLPPLIELRRDSHAFSSPFQDYLASCPQDCTTRMDIEDDWMQPFGEQIELVYSQAAKEIELLHSVRWNLPEPACSFRISMDSLSTTDSDDEQLADVAQSLLLKAVQAVKATTDFWCELTRLLLSSVAERDLIPEYSKRWNAFCAAAIDLDRRCSKFNDVFNEVYSAAAPFSPQYPKFSLVRLMTSIWKTSVLEVCQDRLVEAGVNCLAEFREGRAVEDSVESLWRLASSLLDFSVNERSVHFSQHSQFSQLGPYFALHTRVLAESAEFYSRLDLNSARNLARLELAQLSRCLLPCTISALKANAVSFEAKAWEQLCLEKCDAASSEPHRQPVTVAEQLLTQPLGVLLTKRRPAAVVMDFFRTCSCEAVKTLLEVDSLLTGLNEKTPGDYAIERRAEMLGLSITD